MNKNEYDTYEYLSSNNGSTQQDQVLVVQDDGTFVISKMAPNEDVKQEVVSTQSCVYGVTPQQYYVDVNSSTELITVPENFILSENDGNLYGNNYLLPVEYDANKQMEVNENFQQANASTEMDSLNKDSNTKCTEVTLTDEQYSMLEQKGWVLLESNNKVFLLDVYGLHDITSNEELTQKLRTELATVTDMETSIPAENLPTQADTEELVIGDDNMPQEENQHMATKSLNEDNNITEIQLKKEETSSPMEIEAVNDNTTKETTNNTDDEDVVSIKTKLSFKDIPDRIVLGRTVNGKRLVAKVIKRTSRKKETITKKIVADSSLVNLQLSNTKLSEQQFETLILSALRSQLDESCTPKMMQNVQSVITQMRKVSSFKTAIIENSIFVTKMIKYEDGPGAPSEMLIRSLVTGRVIALDDETLQFVHMPDLTYKLVNQIEEYYAQKPTNQRTAVQASLPDEFNILHLHLTETKRPDKILRISMTLNKRQLPYNVTLERKKKVSNKVFACSSCAQVFENETELEQHQETPCIETDDTLTIDTDNVTKENGETTPVAPYLVLLTDTGKKYSCCYCAMKFYSLSNCQRHLKIHNQGLKATDDSVTKYKCKMCPNTYCHAATLSKHILSAHIKINSNRK